MLVSRNMSHPDANKKQECCISVCRNQIICCSHHHHHHHHQQEKKMKSLTRCSICKSCFSETSTTTTTCPVNLAFVLCLWFSCEIFTGLWQLLFWSTSIIYHQLLIFRTFFLCSLVYKPLHYTTWVSVQPLIWTIINRRQWSLLNRFRTGQGHCNACNKKWGFTDNELYVTVEKPRQCHTSSTLDHWPSLTAVYCAYMKQMRLPSTGWQRMALSTRLIIII